MSENNNSKLGWQKIVLILIAALVIVAVPLFVNKEIIPTEDISESSQETAESSVISDSSELSELPNASDLPESSEALSEIQEESHYLIADIQNLKNTDNFSDSALEHIFDGTINRSGKATGYHYTMISDSKGKLIEGTRSENDEHGVFTGNVEVDGVAKNNFSSFYPESWTPQEVVDAINSA